MGNIKVRHLVVRNGAFYFQATLVMRQAGMCSEPLGKDFAKAIARAETLNAMWDRVRVGEPHKDAPGTVVWLIKQYENHRWYRRLSKKGKQEADTAIKDIRDALGPAHIETITPDVVDEFVDALQQERSDDVARRRLKYLRRMLNLPAAKRIIGTANPASGVEVTPYRPRRQVWTSEQVDRILLSATDNCMHGLALALQLCYDTAQRPGDILNTTWADLTGEWLTIRQGKTGQQVDCPLDARTLAMLAATERRSTQIVTAPSGKPYVTYSYFAKHFREMRAVAGLPTDLRVQDLRRTAATEVSAGGGLVHPVLGHKPNSPATRVYELPNRAAVKVAQDARRKGKEGTKV